VQRIADRAHVDRARFTVNQIGSLERSDVDRIRSRRRQQRATGRVAPRADERRQARDGADRVAAAGVPLHPVVQPDRRRPHRAVVAREAHDPRRLDAADRRNA
jgi:hypothetical protein